MGLLNFFNKPKWKNSDSQVRLTAVENMSVDDLETLLEIIRKDSDQHVRIAALKKVNDRESIELLLREDLPEEIIRFAKVRLEEICTDLIISGIEGNNADDLFALISNQNLLTTIAARADAVTLRCQAVEAIDDPLLLCELLKQPVGKKPALLAVEKINDPHILAEVAKHASNKSARSLAAQKINADTVVSEEDQDSVSGGASVEEEQYEQAALDLEEQKLKNEKIVAEKIQKREAFCAQVESLCSMIGEDSGIRFAEIEKEWPADDPELDDDRLLSLAKRYKDVCRIFHDTLEELRNEKKSMEKLTQYCVQIEKYLLDGNLEPAEVLLQKSVQELEDFSCRLLKKDDVEVRLSACQKKLGRRKDKIAEIAKAEEAKLQAFTDACMEMEKLSVSSYDVEAEKLAKKLNESWKKLSRSAEKRHDEFVARFQAASKIFWGKKEQFYKEQEWQSWNNKTKKEELCIVVESLKEEHDMHQVSSKLKECQAAWRELGPVHKKYSQKLWSRFKSSCDENYERCRVFYAELDQKRLESLAIKEELCVRAEEHVASTKWQDSSEILQGLQKEWKEAGPAVRKKEQVVYKRFKKACDQFFERRNAFYAEQDTGRKDNLLAKEKLCQELEALLQEPNEEHGNVIQEFQKTWKEIGPAPRKDDQKIWKRFRAACDSHYNWLDEQRLDNLQQKIALCEQVEALLAESGDNSIDKEAVEKVTELQQEWKTIGPVLRKDSDAVWKRFSSQCDLFFAARKGRLQKVENKSLENQALKEKLLQRAGEVIQQQDEHLITAGLLVLQEEWKKVGAAPRDQEQQLWDEFESLCNVFSQYKADCYEAKQGVLDENLKKKEELCLQLERITGNETDLGAVEKAGAFDLIEQFKIAREANFLLAGKTDSPQQRKEEVLRIQQEWRTLGPTSLEHEQRLWKRYRKAIDLFFAK
jgi:hypothetical protein